MGKRVLWLIILLMLPAAAWAGCLIEYDNQGNKLGVMYRIEVTAAPGIQVCGRWLDSGVPAKAPNTSRAMSRYCREIAQDGKIFFAIRLRGAEDCSEGGIRYIFEKE